MYITFIKKIMWSETPFAYVWTFCARARSCSSALMTSESSESSSISVMRRRLRNQGKRDDVMRRRDNLLLLIIISAKNIQQKMWCLSRRTVLYSVY